MGSKSIKELIEADDIGPYTEADVRQAEQEANEAEALVNALEERVIDGDEDITPDQIASQRELGRFARLRAQATARKAERARRAARLKELNTLRAEIEGYAAGSGERFTTLLMAAEEACTAFLAAVHERNEKIRTWNHQMTVHQVPIHQNPTIPPAEHACLGRVDFGRQIIAGRRRMDMIEPGEWFKHMLTVAAHRADDKTLRLHIGGRAINIEPAHRTEVADPYATLKALDTPTGDPDPNLVFFRGPGGAAFAYDPDTVPDAETIKRQGLVKVSRKEAWGA